MAVSDHDVIETSPTVRLQLDSRPESLTVVRSMLAGIGEALAFDAELLDDLKTAVSEACNNVVLHAYDGLVGPLLVGLDLGQEGLEVMVRDQGSGIQYVASSAEERMGVGLAVISALADRAEFLSAPDGGTEVRMAFLDRGASVQLLDAPIETIAGPPAALTGDVVVTLAPVRLLVGVLGRVARALAAGARFSLDRFSDVYLVTDALAAHAQGAASAPAVSFAIVAQTRRLEITIGPFFPGSASHLLAAATARHSGSPLPLLADELTVERLDGSELLRLVLLDARKS
jgi:serine/threonine-protein kinase RsbW